VVGDGRTQTRLIKENHKMRRLVERVYCDEHRVVAKEKPKMNMLPVSTSWSIIIVGMLMLLGRRQAAAM